MYIGKEMGGQHDIDAGEEDESPFEFRALEVALEAICSFLAARTTELETAAYPALDELTSKMSHIDELCIFSMTDEIIQKYALKGRAPSAFILYCNETIANLKDVGTLITNQTKRDIGEQWKNLSNEHRQKYKDLAQLAKEELAKHKAVLPPKPRKKKIQNRVYKNLGMTNGVVQLKELREYLEKTDHLHKKVVVCSPSSQTQFHLGLTLEVYTVPYVVVRDADDCNIVRDVGLWRRKKLSISVLLVATAIWVLLDVYEFNFLTLISWAGMVIATSAFLWGNILRLLNKPDAVAVGCEGGGDGPTPLLLVVGAAATSTGWI
ncbi:hypothetical protein RHSIM_RhsimUnG0183100 [Rhododendron simsii]|uniref:Reticulon-like protein n=1 Tax=Rhododendron simsii TaxID=118357 RepID=A0A834FUF6_RHOSS|nr:hypothetical protein RHSIM_RhsimUnG0183100 [Rhododendron simsii]